MKPLPAAACGALAAGVLLAAPVARAQGAAAPPVQAGPNGYLSVGGGVSSFDVGCGPTTQCDRVGSVVRAAAGVFVMSGIAIEAAAADYGHSRIGTPYGDATFGVRMIGLGIALPIEYWNRFNGLLRVGVASVEARLDGISPSRVAATKSTSLEGYYGFTMGYMLTPNLAAELSFDGTRYDADRSVGRVDAVTLGLSLRF